MATWAKGVDFKNSGNTARVGGVGIYGTDGTAQKAYLAVGAEPWNSKGLEVTTSAISFMGNKVYHAGSKPTPAEIGAAASSHGTHVTYSTTAPLANGTASAGSASTVARTDHVHPLQTTVSGNAGSATKLATARTINGTNFDGTANITTANWGTARNITIGSTTKSVNGSGNVAWSLNEIGAAPASHSHASVVMNNCSNKDLNTIKTAGFYCGYTGMTNAPVQAIAVLEVLVYSPDWIVQRFTVVGDGGRKYERHFHSGTTWSAWRTLYDSSNKPTPAEIGAATASHTHSYLPLSGGTLTGRLTANGKVSVPTTGSSWVSGMTLTNASIAVTTQQSTSSYHPILAVKTSGNHVANIGGLGDNFGFYGFKSGRTENATDWSFVFNASSGAVTSTAAITAPTFNGNATTATTLQTARTINGTSFNGSANITTANWGTARTIYIADNAGSNTGTGVSVNGSGNATLKLPATIAATLSGNASTATKLATARTISLGGILSGSASFDGSGNVTISAAANDITTITKSLNVTTSWMDTGITGTNLSTGTYAVQMLVNDGTNTAQYTEYYSGMMSWFADTTNSTDADEILLHKAGHASNGRHVYLRTIRTASSGRLKLQISATNAFSAASSITFKFKKLI